MRRHRHTSRLFLLALLALGPACERDDHAVGKNGTESLGATPTIDLMREPPAAGEAPPTPRVEVAGQWRPALRVQPGAPQEWSLRLPHSARLSLGVAMHPEAWVLRGDGIVARVEVVEGARAHEVWRRWIAPRDRPQDRNWLDADLDLSPWAGRQVRLRILCDASPPRHSVFRPRARNQRESMLLSRPLVYPGEGASPPPNVLLIVVDTLRRDATHFGGHPAELSPALDALAAESVRFRRAWAPSSWTHPSTASLLSGWSPWQHRLGDGPAGTTHLDPDTPMVAQDFQRRGFVTAAISGNSIVSPEEGFARGFDHFDTRAFENEQSGYGAQRITRAALNWIDDHRRQPFFVYLHYFDPHDRYQAPAPYTRRYVDSDLDATKMSASTRHGGPNPIQAALDEDIPGFRVRPEEIRYLRGLYDGEVAYVDHWIGVLLSGVDQKGLLSNTWVVFTSDHGEEFYEHFFVKHGHALHEELVRVPLLVRPPTPEGIPGGRDVDVPVSLMDLAPTLRDLASLGGNVAASTRSWRSLLEGDAAPRPPLLLANFSRVQGHWAGQQRGLVEWPWKWLRQGRDGKEYLFDLSADPRETTNLAGSDPQRCRAMEARSTALYGSTRSDPTADATIDPQRLEKLRALGYVH